MIFGAPIHDFFAPLFLTVENTERVAFEPIATGKAHFVDVVAEELFKSRLVLRAAFFATDTVEVKNETGNADRRKEIVRKRNHLEVERGRIAAVQFDAELMMLAKSAGLAAPRSGTPALYSTF